MKITNRNIALYLLLWVFCFFAMSLGASYLYNYTLLDLLHDYHFAISIALVTNVFSLSVMSNLNPVE